MKVLKAPSLPSETMLYPSKEIDCIQLCACSHSGEKVVNIAMLSVLAPQSSTVFVMFFST